MRVVFLAAACVSILAVLTISIFLFANGIPAMSEIGIFDFLLGKTWRPSNGIYGIFPMILGEFVGIMSGSIIIEQIFGIPGVGPLYVSSITAATPDYNFFMLLSAFYTLIGLLSGIIVDISYGFIDPRIRMGSKK